jgi:hypothetical protein
LRQIERRPPDTSGLVRPRHTDPSAVAAAILFAILIGLAIFTFGDYAVSNDEGVQHQYGALILRYYESGLVDRSLFRFDNLYLYGGLFDMVAVALARVLPFDPYDLRHILCVLVGISGIGFVWATARLIAGSRAGLIAVSTLAVCGSWYGTMFNHTKDIPLATAMAGAVYLLVLIARDLPRPRRAHVIGFGVLTGAALGIKVLGLLIVVYAAVAVVLHLPRPLSRDAGLNIRFALHAIVAFVPALAIAYLIMIVAWPWSALAPLNPVRALISFADFHYHIHTILDGQRYEMATSPRSYVPIYLLIKVPLLTLLGVAIALARIAVRPPARPGAVEPRRREIALIAVAAIFPVVCQFVGHGPAFTGLRHFLFVLPMLSILAGVGLDAAVSFVGRWRPAAVALSAAIAVALAFDASLLVRLHPFEYMAYNQLVGGLPGANRRYVMDYWVNIMPEAVKDLKGYLDLQRPPAGVQDRGRYTVGVCGERVSFEREAGSDVRLVWTPNWNEADFFISPSHMDCDSVLGGTVVARITRLGVLVGVVKDRRTITPPIFGDAASTIGDFGSRSPK